MENQPIAFVAFEESDNLGAGYMISVLLQNGFRSVIIDIRKSKEDILKEIENLNPLIVGFSVIFQYHITDFAILIRFLRQGGVKCHFTAGGQYASMEYNDLFDTIPSLDSIVRFDGEYTFLEMVKCIHSGSVWKNVAGIAYQENGKTTVNPVRPVETDLDKYPIPYRPPLKVYTLGKKFATIIAGRGCVNNCIYCFLREYSRQSSGPYKRIRNPEKVVGEMELLHKNKDCSVFLFQDDDFPVRTVNGSEWIEKFCNELKRINLIDNIIWKINCRPDEVDHETFSLMKRYGLFLVFLGIEDGTDEGLKRLNKHMTRSKCMEGINILKKLEIGFDYGFMLFQPASTFRSVNDNLAFLRELCADGSTPVSFLKMMPYSGTQISRQLQKEGRLKGKPGFYDYNFLEESLDDYHNFVTNSLLKWFTDSEGVLNTIKWARNHIATYSKFFGSDPEILAIAETLRKLTSESNIFILDILQELACLFESGEYNNECSNCLDRYPDIINTKQELYKKQINDIILEVIAHYHLFKYFQRVLY